MRIVVADDSLLLREGLQLLLAEAGHEVVASVGDGPSYVAATLAHRPDVSVVDVRMPPSHTDEGLRAAVDVRAAWPGARIMVLSQYVEVSYADDLLAAGEGGVGYLLKDRVSDLDDFLTALATVAEGGTVLDPLVVQQLMTRRRDPLEGLTPREREVLALMAEGGPTRPSRRRSWSRSGAVEKHTQRIFAKLGLLPATTPRTGGCSPSCATCGPAERQASQSSAEYRTPICARISSICRMIRQGLLVGDQRALPQPGAQAAADLGGLVAVARCRAPGRARSTRSGPRARRSACTPRASGGGSRRAGRAGRCRSRSWPCAGTRRSSTR